MAREPNEPHQQTLELVMDLMPAAGPIGAYCLGTVCALAWSQGQEPPAEALRLAVKLEKVEDAVDLCKLHGIIARARS